MINFFAFFKASSWMISRTSSRTLSRTMTLCLMAISAASSLSVFVDVSAALAKKESADPSLTREQYSQLEKAKRSAKSGGAKANQSIIAIVSTATTPQQCLAIASYADTAGFSLLEARKAALQKAIDLSKTKDDLILVVIKARKLQCFEITSEAIKTLLNVCTSPEDLYDLAKKCQEISLVDISRLALEKILAQTKNAKDALALAQQSRTLGLDDLTRRIVKEVEDDCQTTAECIEVAPQIEEFKYSDANRYIAKKALEKARTVDEFLQVNKLAARLNQQDIVALSAFKGRTILMEQQAKSAQDQAASDQQNADATKSTGTGF